MLTNKTALVTGASRGIGAAIAKALQKKVHLSSSITTVLKSVQMLLRQKSQRMAAKRQFTAAMYLIIVPVKKWQKTSWRHTVIWIFWSTMPVSHGMIF